MTKSEEQKNLEKGLNLKKKHLAKPKLLNFKKNHLEKQKLTPTQEQLLGSKYKYETKIKIAELTVLVHEKSIELENIKHENIIKEIKEMKKQGVTSLNR